MRHQLVGLLGSSIQRDRVIHLIIGGVRHLLIASIDGTGRSVHQMLHRIVTAGFQNVIEANHVALDVSIRVGNGVANSRLSP